ncbi:MAG: CHAP domain-containing protein, partial [Ruminococcus sp.]|nr:CHAP domain-containing protein [Ruminococcus sp.]
MTKTNIHKWVAILVSFLMIGTLFSMLPITNLTASAISCQKDGFDKSRYTLSGNMAEDVATIAKSQKGRTGAQLGYTEPWCDEYVADCIENAGADSSIVGHGGTVADFEAVMRKKGAVEVSSPQVGDLVFFTYSHVEIVTKVENGTVYCAGGNNGGTGNYKTNYCAGERKLYA